MGADLRLFDRPQRGVEECLQLGLGLIDEFAEDRPLVLGDRPHLFHERGEFAVRADEAGLGRLKFRARAGTGECEIGPGPEEQGSELVLHEDNSTTEAQWAPGRNPKIHPRPAASVFARWFSL